MTAIVSDPLRSLVPAAVRYQYMVHALSLGLPWAPLVTPRKTHAAIVGTGPSVLNHLDKLLDWDGPVYAVNGALGVLRANGITPTAWVTLDQLLATARYVADAPEDITYYVASVCHPAVFRALRDRTVVLWHAAADDMPLPEDMPLVGGGSTTLTRAPMLAWMLGANRVTLFGADSSIDDPDCAHADGRGLQASNPAQWVTEVEFQGRMYRTTYGLLAQARYLQYLKRKFPGRLRVVGEGLGPDMVRALERMH